MSVKVMGQVWDLDLPHNQFLVMLALADHADHNAEHAFPGVDLLAHKTGYSERQVKRILRELEDSKVIEVMAHGGIRGGRGIANVYRLHLDSVRRKVPYGGRVSMTPAQRNQLLGELQRRQGPHCAHCHGAGDERNGPDGRPWHVDRILPGRRGGTYVIDNVVMSCGKCNRERRGDKRVPSCPLETVPSCPDERVPFCPADSKGCHPEHERVPSETEKGAIAMAPQPSVNHPEPSVQQITTAPPSSRTRGRAHEDPPADVVVIDEPPPDSPTEQQKAEIRGEMQTLVDAFLERVDERERRALAASLRVIVSGSDMTSWRDVSTGGQVPWPDRPRILDVAIAKHEGGERGQFRSALILAIQQQLDPFEVRKSNAASPGSEAAAVLARGRSSRDEDRPSTAERTSDIDAEIQRRKDAEAQSAMRWLAEHTTEASTIAVEIDEEIRRNEFLQSLGAAYLDGYRERELRTRALKLMQQRMAS